MAAGAGPRRLALLQSAMPHVTVEQPGDLALDVDRRDWESTYGPELKPTSTFPCVPVIG